MVLKPDAKMKTFTHGWSMISLSVTLHHSNSITTFTRVGSASKNVQAKGTALFFSASGAGHSKHANTRHIRETMRSLYESVWLGLALL